MERIWYYAKQGARQGPLTTSEMRGLLDAGTLLPTDLVWSEGMKAWERLSMTELGATASTVVATAAVPTDPSTPAAARVPDGLAAWMQFCGVMLIIGGALQCLTCIGVLYGLPILIAGVGFAGAASALRQPGAAPGDAAFLAKLHSGFKSMGIAMIISIVALLLLFGFYLTIGLALVRSAMGDLGVSP